MAHIDECIVFEGSRVLFEGVDVAELVGRVGTTCYLNSQRQIAANVERMRAAFEGRHAASRVISASKACSNLWFLAHAWAAGAGA